MRRVLRTGLTAAALYAALLGPTGALAQDPTPSPEATATAQQTAVPTQTSTPEASSTPASTATPEVSSTPSGSPEPTPQASPEPTPTAMPSPTPTPDDTAAPTPTSTPDAGTPADVGDFTVDLENGTVDPADGATGSHTLTPCPRGTRAKKVTGTTVATLGSAFIPKTSTSGRRSQCVKVEDEHAGDAHGHGGADIEKDKPKPFEADGTPTLDNPTVSLAAPGPAPIGVPNFFIDKFRIPPFLLSIYQAAGMEYGVRWEVLAAINEIETDYGRNLNVSSAGALGWMQFMPATWKAYGVDANRDGVRDPYNPVDAIFAAARYLRAAGADQDLRKAIFAYNHADWYVDSVIMRARLIGGLPSNFVGSLTGLTQARFPVNAKARYAGNVDTEKVRRMAKGSNAALPVTGDGTRNGIRVFSRRGAPVIAVNDGKVVRMGRTDRLGNFIQLQDHYGNVFTYGHLAKVAKTYPAPRERRVSKAQIAKELKLPKADAKPTQAASETTRADRAARKAAAPAKTRLAANAKTKTKMKTKVERRVPEVDPLPAVGKERLYANPARPAARSAGGELQLAEAGYRPTEGAALQLNKRDYTAKPLRKGARVIAGTILGRIGKTSEKVAPHVLFEIRPAGRGAPRIDPKPILDGWKLLESTEIYRAAGRNPFFGPDAKSPSIGQILLMSKQALQEHVLANPRIEIYGCGRRDVRVGAIDRRVLATLEFLAASGLKPAVSSLQCGHGYFTASGNVSAHSSGNAVDIAAVNGITITPGTQGPGSITEMTIQRLLTLQGTMKPHQIISLMTFEGADNTYAMGDHGDHIHVGWQPMYGTNSKAAKQVNAVLKPNQWIKLIDRLGEIDNPTVRRAPSKYALKVIKRDAAAGKPQD